MQTTLKTYDGWRDEQKAVEAALARVLPTLSRPHLSMTLGALLAPLVGMPEPRVRKTLPWIAKDHPNATQDGGRVRVYGRDVVLWRWHSTPQRAAVPVMGPIETRLVEAGVIDTSDW